MGVKRRFEPLGESLEVGEPALASLRAIRKQPHHRDAGRAWAEVHAAAMGVEQRPQLGSDPMCPLSNPLEAVSLSLAYFHGSIIGQKRPALKDTSCRPSA